MRRDLLEEVVPPGSIPPNATLPKNEFSNFDFQSFLAFRTFITPTLIQIIFILGVLLTFLLGVVGITQKETGLGLLLILFGWIPLRIVCELAMLNFRIHDELVTLNETVSKQMPSDQSSDDGETS